MLTLAGTLAVINSVAAFDSTQQVYNFEVEEYCNYFVGQEGGVHNANCNIDAAGVTETKE